jgi:hypothetical protein
MYVDDLNIINKAQDIEEVCNHLKTKFEMMDLTKPKYCLGLQFEYLPTWILIHQSAHGKKILEKFNMDKAYPWKTPMIVQSLEFRHRSIQTKGGRRKDTVPRGFISHCYWSPYVSCKLHKTWHHICSKSFDMSKIHSARVRISFDTSKAQWI